MSSDATQVKKRDPNDLCLFCKNPRRVSIQHELAYCARESYQVSPGHAVVIPRRHVASFFELTSEEVIACMVLIKAEKKLIDEMFNPDDYNISVNAGSADEQSIFHFHIPIIPHYKGDVKNPQGGVRHVIAKKAYYTR